MLLRGFCYGRSAQNVAMVTSEFALEKGLKKVSRETVSKYFFALGDYLFHSYEEAHLFDEEYLNFLWDLVYEKYEPTPDEHEELSRAGILAYVNTLQKISKIGHGLSKKRMQSHLGHAIFLTVAFQEFGENCTPMFYDAMIFKLEQNPLVLP